MLDYRGRRTTGYDAHDRDDFGLTYGTPNRCSGGGAALQPAAERRKRWWRAHRLGGYAIVIWHLSAVLLGEPGAQMGTPSVWLWSDEAPPATATPTPDPRAHTWRTFFSALRR